MSIRSSLGALALLTGLACSAAAQEKMDRLIVYGQDLAFGVKEPQGWQCLCGGPEAAKLGANAVFVPKGETPDHASAIIRVRVNAKADERMEKDLKYDMEQYKHRYAGIEFKNLDVSHPHYPIYPKLFEKPGLFSEYVTYVNPGPKSKFGYSISMNIQKREANPREAATYREIVASLVSLLKK